MTPLSNSLIFRIEDPVVMVVLGGWVVKRVLLSLTGFRGTVVEASAGAGVVCVYRLSRWHGVACGIVAGGSGSGVAACGVVVSWWGVICRVGANPVKPSQQAPGWLPYQVEGGDMRAAASQRVSTVVTPLEA